MRNTALCPTHRQPPQRKPNSRHPNCPTHLPDSPAQLTHQPDRHPSRSNPFEHPHVATPAPPTPANRNAGHQRRHSGRANDHETAPIQTLASERRPRKRRAAPPRTQNRFQNPIPVRSIKDITQENYSNPDGSRPEPPASPATPGTTTNGQTRRRPPRTTTRTASRTSTCHKAMLARQI